MMIKIQDEFKQILNRNKIQENKQIDCIKNIKKCIENTNSDNYIIKLAVVEES